MYPNRAQLGALAGALRRHNVSLVVSIGAGPGHLEGLLEQWGAESSPETREAETQGEDARRGSDEQEHSGRAEVEREMTLRRSSATDDHVDVAADSDSQTDTGQDRLQVVGIDLDIFHGDFEAYEDVPSYCADMRRVRRGELFDVWSFAKDIAVPQDGVALLFCFGRRLPWQEYIDAFPEVILPLKWTGKHAPLNCRFWGVVR